MSSASFPTVDVDVRPSGDGCAECDQTGSWWLHLSRCAACGHVGCCDDSLNKHATAHAQHTGHKLIDPGLLTLLQRRGALVSLIILGGVLTSYVYFGSLYMQSMLKFAPLTTGLALLPGTVVNIVLAALLSRRIIAKLGIRVTAAIGLLCLAAGQGWFATVSDHGGYVHTALLTSFGIGLTAPALTVAATAGVTKPLQGTGASLVATAQSVGSAVGLAVLGTIANTVTGNYHDSIVDGYAAAFIVAAAMIVAAMLTVTLTFSDHKHTITGAAAAHRMP